MKRLGLAVILIAAGGIAWTEPVKNSWANFKPGTTITLTNKMVGSMGPMKFEQRTTITSTLKEVTENEVILHMVTENVRVMNGQEQKLKSKETDPHYPLMAEPPPQVKPAEGEKQETGEEELTISKRKFKCKWTQLVQKIEGSKVTTKTWTSDEMPGNLVKMESSSEGKMNSEMKGGVVEVDIKE